MSYRRIGLCTVCEDTPQNWRDFNNLKAQILAGGGPNQDFNLRLQARIAAENKQLRSYRTFLPGHGPNR